jgi:hypothetical protein
MKNCIIFFLLAIVLLTGCGTTQLVSYRSDVDIYVNGRLKGKGQAEITRTGPPQKIHVQAKYHGREVGSVDVRRKIKFLTVLVGIYTYGVGFFFTWRYPEMVIIPVNDFIDKSNFNSNESIWNIPPGEYRK